MKYELATVGVESMSNWDSANNKQKFCKIFI